MELSSDIWSIILLKTRTIKNCEKLYTALPIQIKDELKEIYLSHKKSLNLKIICGFQNHFSLYNNDMLEKKINLFNIKTIKYLKNWDTSEGIKDCIMIATHDGIVLFCDSITMEYIEIIEVGNTLYYIDFHPTKSIMLTVFLDLQKREKLKIWRFDTDRSALTIPLEFFGSSKKNYFLHPSDPEIYLFTSKRSDNPNQYILEKVYFCNYENQSVSFSDAIHSYLYLNNLLSPLKIREDGTFDCIENKNGKNYFINFRIENDHIHQILSQPVSTILENFVISDFIRDKNDIYFQINQKKSTKIYRQIDNQCKIIYSSLFQISHMICKNKVIIFTENNELKLLNMHDLVIENISLENLSVDFCVL
jgi:hypothetical protein